MDNIETIKTEELIEIYKEVEEFLNFLNDEIKSTEENLGDNDDRNNSK